jgi:AAA-like domain
MYQVGGSLGANATSYVKRQADADLYQALKTGKFCYVLNSRQMGKSSLKVQMIYQLEAEGVACVSVDITEIGTQGVTMQQWYGALIQRLAQRFDLGDFDRRSWLQVRLDTTTVQVFGEFVETVLLARTTGPIVVFLDEIDSMLRLPFKDDFFALLRAFENKRSENPDLGRLTWCLLGVATPSDLIEDPLRTPFNIAQGIELKGFEQSDCLGLAAGLRSANAEVLLSEILGWTGGQPFLTQKLCNLVNSEEESAYPGQEAEWVSQIVQSQVIGHWESQDTPEHLKTLRDRLLLSDVKLRLRLLGLYRQILQQEEVLVDNSLDQLRLRLTGLVVKRDGALKSYNPIYQRVFDRVWVEQAMTDLRPYGVAMQSWVLSDRQDTESLLSGVALQEAVVWAEDKRLGDQDYRFLAASQNAENEAKLAIEKKANQILKVAGTRAKQRGLLGAGILSLSLLVSVGVAWKTQAERNYFRQVSQAEQQSTAALKLFKEAPLDSLIEAMEAGQLLRSLLPDPQKTSIYPTYTPLQNLTSILSEIKVFNQLDFFGPIMNSSPVSRDGKRFATSDINDTVKLWDEQGNLLNEMRLGIETSESYSSDGNKLIYFSPSNNFIIAAQKKRLVVWDMLGRECGAASSNNGDIARIEFSKDGRYLVIIRSSINFPSIKDIIDVYEIQFSPNLECPLPNKQKESVSPEWNSTLPMSLRTQVQLPEQKSSLDQMEKAFVTEIEGVDRLVIFRYEPWAYKVMGVEVWSLDGKKLYNLYEPLSSSNGKELVRLGSQTIEDPGKSDMNFLGEIAVLDRNSNVYLFGTKDSQIKVFKNPINEEIKSIFFTAPHSVLNVVGKSGKTHILTRYSNEFVQYDRNRDNANMFGLLYPSSEVGIVQDTFNSIRFESKITKIQPILAAKLTEQIVRQTKFSPDGSTLLSVSSDRRTQILPKSDENLVNLWNTNNGENLGKVSIPNSLTTPDDFHFSPDGKFLVMVTNKDSIDIWHRPEGQSFQKIATEKIPEIFSKDIRFSPNSNFLMVRSGENGGGFSVWQVANHSFKKKSAVNNPQVIESRFTEDNKILVLTNCSSSPSNQSSNYTLCLTTMDGNKFAERSFEMNSQSVYFSTQDDQYLVVYQRDTGFILLNPWNGGSPIKFSLNPSSRNKLAGALLITVSPDRKTIAVMSPQHGEVDLLNLEGKITAKLKGHDLSNPFNIKLQFSPDSKKIFITTVKQSTSDDLEGRIRIWTIAGEFIAEYQSDPNFGISLSSDGTSFAKVSNLGEEIHLYPIETLDDILARGCKHLKIYLNSHPEARKRLPICQDPAIQNHRYNSPSPSPSAQSKINVTAPSQTPGPTSRQLT